MRIHRLPLWACALLLVPACASAPSSSAPLVPPGATVVTRPLATARRGGPATGAAYVTAYAASKAFDTILAEGLWQEFTPQGVDVVGCLAGATDTETFREDTGGMPNAMDPRDVAKETLDFLGRGPTFVPGADNRRNVRAMWPTPRIPLIQGLTKANADNFGLPFHVLEGDEFGDA